MTRSLRLTSIVVPTYNERQNLLRLVESIAENVSTPYEIIVVDDASPDGTAELARDLASKYPIRILRRAGKMGLGSAYRAGFAIAQGDAIFEMDADMSHDPRHIPAMLQALQNGGDIVIGSRYVEGGSIVGWNWYRKLVSAVGNLLAKVALKLNVKDVTSGYRCYAAEHALVVQDATSDGYAFQVEVLHLARQRGLDIREVPITFENRTVGTSKLTTNEFMKFLQTLGRLRFAPRRARPS